MKTAVQIAAIAYDAASRAYDLNPSQVNRDAKNAAGYAWEQAIAAA
jgi:hypothetical protein